MLTLVRIIEKFPKKVYDVKKGTSILEAPFRKVTLVQNDFVSQLSGLINAI